MPMSSVEQRRKCEKLGQSMNSLQFLLKFVVRSRFLFSNLNGGKGGRSQEKGARTAMPSCTSLPAPPHTVGCVYNELTGWLLPGRPFENM